MGQPVIQEITLRNFLSFGPETPPFEMKPLNVLIGPNASGKSNFLDALALCRALPTDIHRFLLSGGGLGEWCWKGNPGHTISVELVTRYPGSSPLRYTFAFMSIGNTLSVIGERISNDATGIGNDAMGRCFAFYDFNHGQPEIASKLDDGGYMTGGTQDAQIDTRRSILSQLRDPKRYPQLTFLCDLFGKPRLYRDWTQGRRSPLRGHQPTDLPTNLLLEDYSNLGLVLNRLCIQPSIRTAILARLRDLYHDFEEISFEVESNGIQVQFQERGFTIPAMRLSDGTLRYLCLLAILLNPEPPPVVCIEEPELGLHPDLLPKIADLMVEASERMQLVVTTHSDIIVDALTEHPECVVVCEKGENGTEMKRLDGEKLKVWLDDYRLGDLWMRGHLGGTRW